MEKNYKHSLNILKHAMLCVGFLFAYTYSSAQCNFGFSANASYATCEGSSDGTATLTVWNGVQPYSYNWDNGQTGFFASNLTPGIHNVTVTDAAGCTEVLQVTVEPGPEGIWLMPEATCAGCGTCDGTAYPGAMLGIPPYSYQWSNGQTTETATGLCPGTHFVTVTDTQGCSSVGEVFVCTEGNLTVNCSATDASCAGGDGSVTATPSGGVAPFSYSWSNGSSSATQTGLSTGSYSVTVTDADGCVGSCTSVVNGINSNLTANATSTDSECGSNDGSATVTVSGANGAVIYAWSNGAGTASISNLAPGLYSVTITDGAGCQTTASTQVNGSDAPVMPTISTNDPTEFCSEDGIADMVNVTNSATGSTVCVVTDLNGMIMATGNGPFDFDGFAAGQYQIWCIAFDGTLSGADVGQNVANLAGCFAISNPIDINTSSVEGATISTTDPTTFCVGDGSSDLVDVSIDVAGTGTNSFWVITDDQLNILELPANGPFDFEGAPTGVCTIWYVNTSGAATGFEVGANVADATGCFAVSNGIDVTRNETPTVSIDPTNVEVCAGESVDFSAIGSSNDLTYEWFASQGILSSTTTQNTTFTMMMPGTYQIILSATTPDGCMAMDMTTVTILESPEVTVEMPSNICQIDDCVLLAANATGGSSFTYEWTVSGGNLDDATAASPEFCMNMAGTYDVEVTVTNQDGCTTSASTTVIVGNFNATLTTTAEISSCGMEDGVLDATVEGGNGDYTYEWSNGTTDATNSGLAEGCYSVTITDVLSGCTRTAESCLDDGGINIGNYVWWDDNENCEQDPFEPGVVGVPVRLMSPGPDGICGNADDFMAPNGLTNTDSDGLYLFECVPAGQWYLSFGATILNEGTEYTCRDGATDVTDSDVDEDGKSHEFEVIDTDGDGDGDIIDTDGDGIGNDKEELSFDAGIFRCCYNVNFGGQIGPDQTICPGETPDVIGSISPAGGGGVKPIEYLWICSNVPGPANPASWTNIPNSNVEELNPGPVFQTKFFARCARRECCEEFVIESNIVTIEVVSCLVVATFTAEQVRIGDDEVVRLSWITSNDEPNSKYNIERSTDGANYEVIGELDSYNNGKDLNLYDYMDMHPAKGMNHYRIKIIDAMGTYSFTEVATVEMAPQSSASNFEIFPNPVKNTLTLESFIEIDSEVDIEVISTSGKKFNQFKLQSSTYMNEPLDINTLPAGTYYLRITHGESVDLVKFTKIQ